MSLPICGRARGGGERETTRTGREIGRRRAREIRSRCRSGPASGYNQKSYSVSVAFGFLFVKPEPPSLTPVTDVLPLNRVRLFFTLGDWGVWGARGAGGPGGGGRTAGRSAPPSRAASGAEPGRQADKAPPAPSPHGRAPRGRGKAG